MRPSASTTPARIFVPPRSTPITRLAATARGTLLRRMPSEEKPYRVYRGGRTKGKVPAPARPGRRRDGGGSNGTGGAVEYRGPDSPRRRVSPGLLLSHESTILLLGTDHSKVGGREGDRHSDSILLVHTDPSKHRIAYLSIPRDLRVSIPGYLDQKINAAFQIGGPTLALKTIKAFTGIPVNHVVIVDFADFRDLVDALGGVDIDVPAPIVSNPFDCPYATEERCQRWQGWRFARGKQHMDGRRALVYARIRENRLDPTESDVTRSERQQR